MSRPSIAHKRVLPKLMACMTKTSLENLRNKALFSLNVLDAKGIRRRKLPLHECLALELKESGFVESSNYLIDLLYDNMQLMAEDEIGIVVDLRRKNEFLEHISAGLQKAEKERDKVRLKHSQRKDVSQCRNVYSKVAEIMPEKAIQRLECLTFGNAKKECIHLLKLAIYFAEQGKGILWLAEKFFLASMAVSSQYLLDGGAQKSRCKYHYSKFLLDKFPDADTDEPYQILTVVRDASIGKDWLLYEPENDKAVSEVTVFIATAIQLHRVLIAKSKQLRKKDPGKSERLARLAERRARDAGEVAMMAEAIIEIGICQLIMNNLNNAQKTLERAFKIHTRDNNVAGICETKMHLAAVMQKIGDHEAAAKLLTEMGALAMQHGLRRQLGRALHLLGELHLRREKPELGTHHLAEAFNCFMGLGFEARSSMRNIQEPDNMKTDLKQIMAAEKVEIYIEEAEQSRLMMAISAGQELMASYFAMLREAHVCNVAQMKTMEWKLNKAGWWAKRRHHDTLPCMCPVHHRTPLDCLQISLDLKARSQADYTEDITDFSREAIGRIDSQSAMTELRSRGPSTFKTYSSEE